MLTQKDMVDRMLEQKRSGKVLHYKKYGRVEARLASRGEEVATIVGGKVETTNIAKAGDYVIRNPTGELYIIGSKKFKDRYTIFKGRATFTKFAVYQALGEAWSYVYSGPHLKFKAPWGEPMLLEPGDMVVSTNKDLTSDVYRIEKKAFAKTYKRAA